MIEAMKTIKELKQMIGGEIESTFDYSIDHNRRFRTLSLSTQPDVWQVQKALRAGYELVAKVLNVECKQRVVYYAIPIDRKSYEFEPLYVVYIDNNVEFKKLAQFETLDEAKKYCNLYVKGDTLVDDEDNDYEGRGNNYHLEVYEDGPVDEEKNLKDTVYETERYYNN